MISPFFAVRIGNVDIVRTLLRIPTVDLSLVDDKCRTIVQLAVESDTNSSLQCLELLIEDSRINWNLSGMPGETPLMYTWRNKKSEMFKKLMTIPNIDLGILQSQVDPFILECLKQELCLTGRAIPECPVCYVKFSRNIKVFQCSAGHFVCERCYHQIQSCPKCRGPMIGRCHDFEQFLINFNISN